MKKNNFIKRKRTFSRLIATQILYQYEFFERKQDLEKIKNDLIDNYIFDSEEEKSVRSEIDIDLINNLLNGFLLSDKEFDEDIKNLPKKSQEIDNLMLQLIRLAAFELKVFQDISLKIIIDEYIDIAALFFDENKLSFLNWVLDNLAKKYRKSGII